ncbi:MAG: HAD domain-containing protein [Eubacteriales bacterium]|nr:HAD domain-containing protein [Eubacteriales bacterium]
MKIIFLDIDGVLNSQDYYEKNQSIDFRKQPFDPACILCLQTIVKETGAKIVLSSSWRGGWNKDPSKLQLEGSLLNEIFSAYGIEIYDKTPSLLVGKRPMEILAFLKEMKKKKESVDSFLIIDDNDFGWKKYRMDHRLVKTDFIHGGLKEIHVKPCIDILTKKHIIKDLLFRITYLL